MSFIHVKKRTDFFIMFLAFLFFISFVSQPAIAHEPFMPSGQQETPQTPSESTPLEDSDHSDEMSDGHVASPADGHNDSAGGHGHPTGHLDTQKIANYLLWLILLMGSAAIVWVSVSTPASNPKTAHFDLLSIKPLAKIIRYKYFRITLQLINVAVFLTIIYLGFYGIQVASKSVTYSLTWYFWWPVFFLLILFLGRIWCMVCPFAALADWVQKLVNLNKKFPKKLQNLWIATILFLVLHFAYIWWIRGNPWMTALAVIVGFIIPAIAVGVVYQRRNFCQYVCPLGGLLTVYSLISPLQLTNRSDETCQSCRTKDCYKGNELGQGCPVSQVVPNIKRTGDCLLCMECAKTCRNDNVALKLRPFGSDLWNSAKRTFDESTIGVLMVGLVVTKTAIMLEPWYHFVVWFANTFGLSLNFAANLLFVGLTFAFPLAFTFLAIWFIKIFLSKGEAKFWDLYKVWGYMLVPVALALQIAHELDHLLNEGPYVITAVGTWLAPAIPAFQSIAGLHVMTPLSSDALFIVKILLPVIGFIFTLLVGYRMANKIYTAPKTIKTTLIPMYALTIVFTIVSVYLMGIPMGGH